MKFFSHLYDGGLPSSFISPRYGDCIRFVTQFVLLGSPPPLVRMFIFVTCVHRTATGYRLDGPRFEPQRGRDFPDSARPAPRLTHSPVQFLSRGVKRSDVALTAHPLLAPESNMGNALPRCKSTI